MSESYVWAGGYFSYDGSNGDGKYRDLAYVGNKLLIRPYNKSELIT